jgi:threonine synthase
MTTTLLPTGLTALPQVCKLCGAESEAAPIAICEHCLGPLEPLSPSHRSLPSRAEIAARAPSMWRYREWLPFDGDPVFSLDTGFTPLVESPRLAAELGVARVWVKNDAVSHPTLSFKDRVVATAINAAHAFGLDTVGCASTGNLANSVSAHGAKAGLKRFIFIPHDLEPGKVIGSLIYQPNLIAVEGNYDDVNRLCSEIASKYRWAFVNVNMRPYYTEGAKTYGFEIAEQLGWQAPQNLVCPVAGGTILPKIWKAFQEFEKLGLIPEVKTKVFAAQAGTCCPVINAIHKGTDIIRPVKPMPMAESVDTSLRIGNPADGPYVVQAIQSSGGHGEMATNDEIIAAIQLLAATEGIWTETAGGTTLAVAKKLIEQGKINRDESTVVCITGNGLKTLEAVKDRIGAPTTIAPTLASFEERVLNA